jgi:hypothetical protein
VEAFEVIKLGFATDFKILELQNSLLPRHDDLRALSNDIIEYHPTKNVIEMQTAGGSGV